MYRILAKKAGMAGRKKAKRQASGKITGVKGNL
jgi:hypothetical protein